MERHEASIEELRHPHGALLDDLVSSPPTMDPKRVGSSGEDEQRALEEIAATLGASAGSP